MDYSNQLGLIIQSLSDQSDFINALSETISVLSGQLAFITLCIGVIAGFIFIKSIWEVISKWF